ncbi:MAG: 2-dehydropantoate 2-reductase [Verrucomicrobia bacterium]|nr:2-dehydropantoate 2-reductase [Verrucomicrobiota bacterium]MBT7699578.1 2-dehydropantoate 2-reductase [Verrucomicrobiota bacterium]
MSKGDLAAELCIVGPGAMGCLLACRLSATGNRVALVDHDPARAARLNGRGIVLVEDAVETEHAIPVIAPPFNAPPPRWLLICVKRPQTPAALRALGPLLGPESCLVSFQNGIGHEALLAEAVGKARLLCAASALGATLLGEGRVKPAGAGCTRVAAWSSDGAPQAAALVALLAGAGLEAREHPDVRAMLWSKLIVNAAINPVTALAGVPNGALLERDVLRRQAHAAAREGEAVAAALGIALDYADACRRVDEVCAATAANRSSMLQDVERGSATEIDCINGAIVAAGREAGIAVGVNEALCRDILGIR